MPRKKSKVTSVSVFDDPNLNPNIDKNVPTQEEIDGAEDGVIVDPPPSAPEKKRGRGRPRNTEPAQPAGKKAAPRTQEKVEEPMTEQKRGRGRPAATPNAKVEKLKEQIAEANEKTKDLRENVKVAKGDVTQAQKELKQAAKELKAFETAVSKAEKQVEKDQNALTKHLEKIAGLKEKMAEAKS